MNEGISLGANACCESVPYTTEPPMPEHIEVHNEDIVDEFERRLAVGQRVKNPEDAYLLYCEYGCMKGFSVRKGKQAYFHDNSGELYMKEFDCSCNGTKDEKRNTKYKQAIYLKMETRTGCTARLRIGRKKNEEWRVIIFDIEHNHDMVAADQRYMLRSARNISYAKGDTLKALVDAGFSIANAYSYMQQESHGRENIGFLKKDALNNNTLFKNMFHKCMEFCESEEEFEEVWSKMIADYSLYDHSWLKNMYKLRHKWSTAFSKKRFSAGLKATSRSEGTNSTLKDGGKKTHTLFECVLRFEKVQNKWRQDEKENDFKCRHGMPTLAVKMNCLLRDAAVVYTHTIYNMFQSELINSLGIDFDGQPTHCGNLFEFKVRSQGNSNRVRKVEFDSDSHEIRCTCQYFESVGILCKHALLVFKQMNVHKIPTRYIKMRWTKNIRNRVSPGEEYLNASDHESQTVFVNQTMRFCYDLTMRSKVHIQARNLVRNELQSVLSNLNALIDALSMDDTTTCSDDMGLTGFTVKKLDVVDKNNIMDDEHVCNPLYVKSRGVNNVRFPSHWDSKSKRGKENIKSSKRTTKSTKKKVRSSQPSQPSQESSIVLSSQGATGIEPLQYAIVHQSQEIPIGSQSSGHLPYWLYHKPSSTMNVSLQSLDNSPQAFF
ncbi:hypothetical protein DH2020_018508 [Rehmannia glutinosa]|uniref:SWIM-type domain-containing protein n=1 Tax=Rehmannia glutinosa TaxID=99300 RepID=A0ABR0WL44_REHGL